MQGSIQQNQPQSPAPITHASRLMELEGRACLAESRMAQAEERLEYLARELGVHLPGEPATALTSTYSPR